MNAKRRQYHAPVWDEPVIMELGAPGRRGIVFDDAEPEMRDLFPDPQQLLPSGARRSGLPDLPELSEPEVLHHYLRLSQQTLGMMGVSLFGTCTMKYNSALNEIIAAQVNDLHPLQHRETLQGVLEIVHRFDLILRELSGMDQFVFQAGGGADAAYLNACMVRAYHAARGEGSQRDEIITSIQAHPCNPATAAAAGFKVTTLMLGEEGYPSLDALKAAVSHRTAALVINNPDDMGIYNPDIKEWIKAVHEVGGLCFYDHANFNGLMSKVRARELGFDACMFMLHKTFGAPKGGGGPAVGAYGCSRELAPFLPTPVVVRNGNSYAIDESRPQSIGKIREFMGNIPQILKAYAWSRAMGADGISTASDISVLANNYMERRLLQIRGITRSHPNITKHRLEMTRFSFQRLKEETGIGTLDVQNRMVDYGMDAYWLSHEPWLIPEPFTPEAGEMYGKDDIDRWIDVIAAIVDEAYTDPEMVRSAPHRQSAGKVKVDHLGEPDHCLTTWRAFINRSGAAAS